MIKTMYNKGRYYPLIVCDACGKPIENVGLALAINARRGSTEGALLDTFHVHKGVCDKALSKKIDPVDGTGSDELRQHLRFLVHNVGLTTRDFEEMDDRERDIGSL